MKTHDNAGNEDPEAMAAVTEMKTKMMDCLPTEWKKDIGGDRLVDQIVLGSDWVRVRVPVTFIHPVIPIREKHYPSEHFNTDPV